MMYGYGYGGSMMWGLGGLLGAAMVKYLFFDRRS